MSAAITIREPSFPLAHAVVLEAAQSERSRKPAGIGANLIAVFEGA